VDDPKNMFITFEGLDFSGKSTQAKLLVDKIKALPDSTRRVVHFFREPGGTKISERIRAILLDKEHLELSDTAELLLFSASRSQLVTEVIIPALGRGEIVVCDRYCDSTTAYQGYGRGLNLEAVRGVNRLATGATDPDITFVIDIPVAEIERRKAKAGIPFDRMESAGKEFYERVRSGYMEIAKNEPNRLVVIDGATTIQDVEREVWRVVKRKLNLP
jgi:dTMP kinase